jgi:predicted phage gp36 major capsid-like protein
VLVPSVETRVIGTLFVLTNVREVCVQIGQIGTEKLEQSERLATAGEGCLTVVCRSHVAAEKRSRGPGANGDPSYRPNASFLMHDSTLGWLQRLLDKYGRPLWSPGISVGAPDLLYGKRYFLNPYMATLQSTASSPAVTNTTIIFGDLTKYTIRRVKEMSILRLEERYADYGQVGFLAFARYDGNLLDAGTHPVVSLVNSF